MMLEVRSVYNTGLIVKYNSCCILYGYEYVL